MRNNNVNKKIYLQEYKCISLLNQIAEKEQIQIVQINNPSKYMSYDCEVISGDSRYYLELKYSDYRWIDRIDRIWLKKSKLIRIYQEIQHDEVNAIPWYFVFCNDGLVIVDVNKIKSIEVAKLKSTQFDDDSKLIDVEVCVYSGDAFHVIPFIFDFKKAENEANKLYLENENRS